jgi:TP901 family phage tail tape measure protein
MAVQINVQASQTALAQSISQGVAAYNARFASQNQLNLQINPRTFSQPLGRITSDLADFESALKASNARVLAFGASTAVLGGSVKLFKEIANVTMEVEKSLTDVNRVLGLSTSGLQKFSTELFTISKQTASSFDDATKAALEFSRQGLNTEETLKRTADALTLVRLTGIGSKQAVEDLTSTINGFSKAGLTTTQIVNKLAAVEQDFAVSASDLSEALSRTGQAAQEAGVGFDELNALVTTAQQSTARGGAVIGNALKTIFTRLQRTDTLDQLEKFNIIVRDVEGGILPAVQILQNFANKYNDLADAQRAQLSEQVAGVYQVNILKGIVSDLTNNQGTYIKALERGSKATNEADVANQKLNKTLSALSTQTGLGLQQLANNVGKVTFAPIFEAIVSPINDAVKYINETLEGEGPGSIFANGLLKGIRNVITGPGLALAFAVIAKVAKNTFEDATKALPAILGLTTEAQKRANIEKSIIAILQTQSNLSLALQGQQGNATAQAATVLNYAKLQTAQYQQQLQIAQQLAPLLAAQNVTIGARGVQVGAKIKAGGHIPAFAEMSERMGAAMGGYKSGKVVKAPRSVGTNAYMNTAEETKYVPGFAQPFINPPAGSKAGRAHRQNAISKTGVDPYMANGFVPNFASDYLAKMDAGKVFDNTIAIAIGLKQAYLEDNDILDYKPFEFKDPQVKEKLGLNNKTFWGDAKLSEKPINLDSYISKIIRSDNATIKSTRSGNWYVKPTVEGGSVILPQTAGGLDKNVVHKTNKRNLIAKNKSIAGRLSGISDEDIISSNLFLDRTKVPLGKTYVAKGSTKKETAEKLASEFKSGGFIPNFAPPTSAIRIPWFKKFGNAAFDKIQPTLGISKASDVDTFRQIGFRSTAKGADENGDPNIFGPLYETFSRKALQLINKSNIFGEFVRGSVLQPRTKSSQTAFDDALLQDDGIIGLDFKGFPKKNLSGGSVAKHMNDKLKTVAQTDPEKAAKIKEAVMVFNETGHENQLPSEFGKNFLQLAGTSYSQMLKNSPDLVKGLSTETNSLLDNYVKDPAFLAMNAAKGFVPNFAGKDIATKFFRTQTGSELFPKGGTGLSGTVYRQPGYRSSGYQLKEQLNNMVMSILGNNVFFPDASSISPKIYRDVNKAAEDQAKGAALKLSGKGRDAALGFKKGMMNQIFGDIRSVADREAVFTGEVSGKMKRVNYDKLSDILGAFWSANTETKSAWESLKNTSETGKLEEKENIRAKTSLLKKAYEDFLIKNNYIGTRVKLSSYRKRVEGADVNYGALRSDLAGVSNVRNIDDKHGGFIPNFASMISSSIKGKGNISAIKTGKNNYEIEGVEVGKKFRGQGLGSQLYGSIAEKIGSGSTIKSVLLPQEQALADYASGKSIPAKAIFPQLSWAKRAKSSKLLINGKEIAMSDFESGIAGHKYNAAKLDMALIELVNSHASGFIPNFAYKQAVMGLEESMSGNKAILDTKSGPFPFIRNTSQSNFASAISDHGGLSNALSDSMRNQEAAGLMSKGFVPNFATLNAKQALGIDFGALLNSERSLFVELNKALSQLTKNTNLTAQQQQILQNTVQQNAQSLQQSTKSGTIVAVANNALVTAIQQNQNAQQRAAAAATAATAAAAAAAAANQRTQYPTRIAAANINTNVGPQSNAPAGFTFNQNQSRFGSLVQGANQKFDKISSNVGFQIAVPMIAGQLESIIAQGKDRSEMGYGRRLASTGASAALTGASTGALIGSIIPGFGTALGAAVGAAVGFGGAILNARSTVDDFAKSIQDATKKDKEVENAVEGYSNALRKIEEGGLSPKETIKVEKERQKYLGKIPAALRASINPEATASEVQNRLEALKEKNQKKEQVAGLSILGAPDLTKDQFDQARQAIAELALTERPFKVIAANLTLLDEAARKSFLAKGGGLEKNLAQSEYFTSQNKGMQEDITEAFRIAFNPNDAMGVVRTIALSNTFEDLQNLKTETERTKPDRSAKKSASSIYLDIEKSLSDASLLVRRSFEESEFDDKLKELTGTFENSLVKNILSPIEAVDSELKLKKELLTNSFNRENKKTNLQFAQTFAEQIKSTPILGGSPNEITRLEGITKKGAAMTASDAQEFLKNISPEQVKQIPAETLQKLQKIVTDQKELEKDRETNLTRETKILEENNRQLKIKEQLTLFESSTVADISYESAGRQRALASKEITSKIQRAKEEAYLNYAPNFYNMGMQKESELRIGYRQAQSTEDITSFTKNELESANSSVLGTAKSRIQTQMKEAQLQKNSKAETELKRSPLLNQQNIENLQTLNDTIQKQKEYLNSLNNLSPLYATAKEDLKALEGIQANINNKVKEETELLKIKNAEERKRLRDSKSFSVGLSAGFDQINKERETFANDFGQKIPGLFRDGLVGAMDAALNKADDLESALKGVAAGFLREIQGVMLRNIANNVVSSMGSAFSFGQTQGEQRGGLIRAQSGMYISGGRTGDKNPAMLEDGEYVLNRNAVQAMGGPSAIDQLNFNTFPRFGGKRKGGKIGHFAVGGDPGSMSASVNLARPFEDLSGFGREQSPEFQVYMDEIREAQAKKDKKKAENKALLNQFIGTVIGTGLSMGISYGLDKMSQSFQANANLKGATGALSDGTTTAVSSFSDAKSLINSGGSVTLTNGSSFTKADFGKIGFNRSSFNEFAANKYATSGISVNPGGAFGGTNYNLKGTTTPYESLFPEYGTKVNANFNSPSGAYGFSRNISNFKPQIPNVRGRRQEGGAIGFNQGGFLPYGSRLTDSIPAYLSGGEYVVNSKAVRKYGVGGLNRINSGVARFAEGGMVGDNQSESNNTSNSTANNVSINITVNANGNGDNKEEKDTKGEGTQGPANELSAKIKSVVLEVISTEQRTGGLLDSTKKR